jgi:hypothetical protein
MMEHQHLGLAEFQAPAGLGEIFDTLAVFENYPVDRETCPGISANIDVILSAFLTSLVLSAAG